EHPRHCHAIVRDCVPLVEPPHRDSAGSTSSGQRVQFRLTKGDLAHRRLPHAKLQVKLQKTWCTLRRALLSPELGRPTRTVEQYRRRGTLPLLARQVLAQLRKVVDMALRPARQSNNLRLDIGEHREWLLSRHA